MSPQGRTVQAGMLAVLLLFGAFAAGGGSAQSAAGSPRASGTPVKAGVTWLRVLSPIDQDTFQPALRSMDLFLMDWMQGDLKDATQLVAPNQRRLLLRPVETAYFANQTGAGHVAFEVVGSRRLSSHAYVFSVWMYVYVMGAYGLNTELPRRRPFEVQVRQTAPSGAWLVENIPDLQR